MKKKQSIFFKLLFLVNSIFALLLLLAYILPYIKPENLGGITGISLLTPVLILINLGFVVFWLTRLSSRVFLSLILLLIGFSNLLRFYNIFGKKVVLADDIKLMSYNVRMFNQYKWSDDDSIPFKIKDFITNKAPDIICFQEYTSSELVSFDYPYKYEVFAENSSELGHAILSKYPIVNKGSFDFKGTANNILYADIKIKKDTLRVYNFHLQSIGGIQPDKEKIDKKNANRIRNRIAKAYHKQQVQVEAFLKQQETVRFPIVIAGDFNNTAYSWVYRSLLKGKNDAFVKAGKGFGKTFNYMFPVRIDFILLDKKLKVNHFRTYQKKYSDHYPILTRIKRNSLTNK